MMHRTLVLLSLTTTCLAWGRHGINTMGPPANMPSLMTSTLSATMTLSVTDTVVTTIPPPSSSSSSPPSPSTSTATCPEQPRGTVTILTAVKKGAPFHLKPLTASGLAFYLGNNTRPATYCPSIVSQSGTVCPAGNVTGIHGCSMAVMVPGGQMIYMAPTGALGYTQAHSSYVPPGSIYCPLQFEPTAVPGLSCVTMNSWKSDGFMACPLQGYWTNNATEWQVFMNGPNATVPNGAPSSCVPFETLAFDVDIGSPYAAWQYT